MKKCRRFISIVLIVIMLLPTLSAAMSVFAVGSVVAQGNCGAEGDGSNVTYVLYDDGTLVISGTGEMCERAYFGNTEDIINVRIENGVTSIGYAFKYYNSMESITIAESVASIDDGAFYGCRKLSSIIVDENNNNYCSVDGVLFNKDKTELIRYKYSKTDTSYIIPNSVTTIGDYAFEDRRNISSVIIPNSVTTIGDYAFEGCGFSSIIIPDSVTSIGDSAFGFCTSLQSIEIPKSVTNIGCKAFADCRLLTEIIVNENNKKYCSVDGVLFNYDKTSLIVYPEAKTGTSYTIPDSVTNIGASAFFSCIALESIAIPESVTNIGASAFFSCIALESITIPNSVTTIGDYAFYGCGAFESIEIPNSVTYIGDSAFNNCKSLESITISDSVTYIGDYAFSDTAYYNNKANWENGVLYIDNNLIEAKKDILGHYTVKNGTKIIANGAFRGCSSLLSVTFPESLKKICIYAFYECDSFNTINYIGTEKQWKLIAKYSYFIDDLTTITVNFNYVLCPHINTTKHDAVAESCTEDGYTAGVYCNDCETWISGHKIIEKHHINKDGDRICDICNNPIPIVAQGNCGAEGDGSNLTYALFEDGYLVISGIGQMAEEPGFGNIGDITNVKIENGVTNIGMYAFDNCKSLKSITIPDSVTSIDIGAFAYCKSLQNITIPDSVTSIGEIAFYCCYSLSSITIPNSVENIDYGAFIYCISLQSITISESVESIGDVAFYLCSSLSNIIVDTKSESFCSEDGVLYNKDKTMLVRYPEGKTDASYIIPGSVESIGFGAFGNCSNLESVTMSDSVTSIGEAAFDNCSKLSSITISTSTESIAEGAFDGCTSLQNITIPDSVTSIGEAAFYDCASLKSVTIPSSVESIGAQTFFGCCSLQGITIPDSVKSIGDCAFYACESLKSITIPDSVTYIGEWAFYDCSGLQRIIIPGSVASIGDYAFGFCNSLESVIISEGVETIGENAFYACESLKKVALPESLTEIKNYAFRYCDNINTFVILSEDFTVGYRALPSVLEGYYFVAPDMEANVPQDSSIIPFTYEDNVLSFSYSFEADSVYFLDLIAVFCMYYGTDRIIDSVKFEELRLIHQYDDEKFYIDAKNVEVIAQLKINTVYEPCSFTQLCFYNSNKDSIEFKLISLGTDCTEVKIKTEKEQRAKSLAAIVMLLNKLFSFFRLFTN